MEAIANAYVEDLILVKGFPVNYGLTWGKTRQMRPFFTRNR
jgi:hypothetical protein